MAESWRGKSKTSVNILERQRRNEMDITETHSNSGSKYGAHPEQPAGEREEERMELGGGGREGREKGGAISAQTQL